MVKILCSPFSEISATDRRAAWVKLCEEQLTNGTALPETAREYSDYAPRYYGENLTEIAMKTKLEDMPKLCEKLKLLAHHELSRLRRVKSETLKPLSQKQKAELEDDARRVTWGYSGAREPLAKLGLTRKLLKVANSGFDINDFQAYLQF